MPGREEGLLRAVAAGVDEAIFVKDLDGRYLMVNDAAAGVMGRPAEQVIGKDDQAFFPKEIADRLREMNVGLVLNPIHDYMTRHEMRKKRCHYSLGGRTVLSVWNQGRGKESYLPWTVFHDGAERTDTVRELPRPFSDRPDIRIGIVDLSSL